MTALPKKEPSEKGLHRVLFDFDGVLAEDTWPKPGVGDPIPAGVKLLKKYAKLGYEVSIFTSRPDSHKDAIWSFIYDNDLDELVYDIITDKPVARWYIDDRALNPWGEEK